jgi:hypothetical protein
MKVQTIERRIRLQEWASQIEEQAQSGMTVMEWCQKNNVGYKNFFYRKRRVREELLEEFEKSNNSKSAKIATINQKQLSVKNELPIITPLNIPQTKGAALTVWIGHYAVDIQNGADAGTIDQVLNVVSRL